MNTKIMNKALLITGALLAATDLSHNSFWEEVEKKFDEMDKKKPGIEPRKLQETQKTD